MTIQETLHATNNEILARAKTLPSTIAQHSDLYVYVDRQAPVTLVAHVDTVRGKDPLNITTINNIIRNKTGVLGADDRAGVYALFALANENVNLLFTNYEETGGRGAVQAAQDLNTYMEVAGVKLLIELDRKGANEYVYYSDTLPKQIKAYIESYGFVPDYGSYSDIAEFDVIPAVNLSIGYYAQHTSREALHVDEMRLTISRVREMIKAPPKKLYKVKQTNWDDDYYDFDKQEERRLLWDL